MTGLPWTPAIVVDGKRLEARWWGPGPGGAPTLVLLHEGLGCVALWRDIPERLAAATGFGVFAYSRLGYGHSDPIEPPWPMTYMHDEALKILPRVLDAAGIKRAILIGHSDGGSIAAIHAGGIRDSRIAGIVTIAAHFFVEDLNISSIEQIRTTYETSDLRERLARYHAHPDVAFRGWNGAWLDPRFRAFDKDNGKELWVTRLPASAHATPMTFLGRTSKKQYVVVAAGGGNKYNDVYTDALVAFTLP